MRTPHSKEQVQAAVDYFLRDVGDLVREEGGNTAGPVTAATYPPGGWLPGYVTAMLHVATVSLVQCGVMWHVYVWI